MNDPLKDYMKEAKRLRDEYVLEEEDILERLRNGDDSARPRLVEGNLLLVVLIAHEYKHRGLSLEELISEGNHSLRNCSTTFDATTGCKFSSYLGMAIRRRFHQVIAANNTLLKPTNSGGIKNAIRMRRWVDNFSEQNGREPTVEEIQEQFPTFSKRRIKNYLLHLINRVGDTDEWQRINEIAVCTSEVGRNFQRRELWDYLRTLMNDHLTRRESRIVKMRTGIGCEPMTLEEVSDCFGITRERIRQIYMQALRKLASHIDPGMIGHIKLKREIEENSCGILT